nr:hypothetical protein [Tanacetum cinerariifolium]
SPRQILHPNTFEMIIQSSANIIERPIAESVQFINPHQPVLLVFILIDESSWIGVRGVSLFALQIRTISDSDDSTFRVDISCRLPVDSQSIELLTFSPPMRDSPESMCDDQSLSVEDVREKIYSKPLFDEEIIPMEIDPHSLNAESDLIESM